uniref:Uncharacterized protein n=1 Tax=Anguilla anguilla TaxID=7936 RepID=A0A0E9SBW0_ANGAN
MLQITCTITNGAYSLISNTHILASNRFDQYSPKN